ncbi:chorismate mutase [Mycobacterium avium subsp. hominissuis]|uniref:Chorismate mutase n=2 Tax=Mycobacterium avium TaxID=1764 RepID=A0A3B6X959_MYCAV|nr:chorismate mutase [Mycobacterium avium]EUA36822.1 putative chorismate mutase [Mycobacterium avium subsp. avium 2285 (R)]TXA41345.1 chorismate mutase [Mycobacterium tuberculosis variant bovis]ABK67172.1 chorismate mutase [Mycobacterium avium 104]APA75976.1 chorismate mutase [Mycobacterium avium subsp. hominissuis]AXO23393.1 chorismate mutase [Mycobacterium avium subsp. hominissuis]
MVVVGCLVTGALAGAFAVPAAKARADTADPLTELVDTAVQRLQLAEPVAAYKWNSHGAVEDPARVAQQLALLGDQAAAENIDRDYVTRVFGDQIRATEAIEYSRFASWKLNPGEAPADAPDLTASRAAIDDLSRTMLTALAADWPLLHSPACAALLADARRAVVGDRRLDTLYQRALTSATQSYCQQ